MDELRENIVCTDERNVVDYSEIEISEPIFISNSSEMWCSCCKEGGNE